MKIVVISPNTANLAEMAVVLTALSHQVVTIEGGKGKMRGASEQHAPDLMLVEGMCCDPAELAQVEHVIAVRPGLAVVLLCATHTPEFLMQSMRIGVREVLPSPASAETLRGMAARVEARLKGSAARAPGRILAFVPCKGGSGATFLAANMGYQLAQNFSVLLIDLNLQLGDALATLHDGKPASTVADVARAIDRLDASLLAASAVAITPRYSVLAAPEDPAQALEVKPEHVEAILAVAVREYDFVLLDMSRSIDSVAIRALDRAWRIYPVAQLTVPALRNARQLLGAFRSLGYAQEKVEVIVNRFDKTGPVRLEDARKSLGNVVLRTVPNSYKEVNSSIDHGTALVQVARSNAVARSIVDLADSLRPRLAPAPSLLDRLLKRA